MNLPRKSIVVAGVESTTSRTEQRASVEAWLGRVLRIGVSVTVAILLLGLGLFVVDQLGADHITRDAAMGRGVPIQALTPGAIIDGLAAGNPASVIQLGLLALILTPIARVAVTTILFWRQGDRPFILFSGIVLMILVLGLLGIGA
jgi:uncharacterized membrane protein